MRQKPLNWLSICILVGGTIAPALVFGKDEPSGFPTIEFSIDGGKFQNVANELRVPAIARRITVKIGDIKPNTPGPVPNPKTIRFSYQFSGIDRDWQLRHGEMGLVVRFYNEAGNLSGRQEFYATRESPGWTGSFDRSKLLRRREFVAIPKGIGKIALVITSAGAPDAVGVYVANNISIYRSSAGGNADRIFHFDLSTQDKRTDPDQPESWIRDGTNASMAHIVHLDSFVPQAMAFCIIDNDHMGHAEWRLKSEAYLAVHPDETLMIEWYEMYSIGLADQTFPSYNCPPPGRYQFRVRTTNVMGVPIAEKTIDIVVYQPYWRQLWFWCVVAAAMSIPILLGIRFIIRIRVRRHMLQIEQEHMLEKERLRIARNIHDDLGARLTHISLVSSRSEGENASLEELRSYLRRISLMTRDLVTSLYETVWTVDPENDNLNALVSHLAEMVENMCQPAAIQCRTNVPEKVSSHPISSGVRHAASLTVKEAVHNSIKHSGASEIATKFSATSSSLRVEIFDNGRGFDLERIQKGNGLTNMHQRMNEIDGRIEIKSAAGQGTRITLEIPIR